MGSKTCVDAFRASIKLSGSLGYQPTRSLDDIINDVANEYRNEVAAACLMMNKRNILLLFLLSAFCLLPSVFAQGGIKGKVRNNKGNGIAGATVTARLERKGREDRDRRIRRVTSRWRGSKRERTTSRSMQTVTRLE
jgi:hypothetical protein